MRTRLARAGLTSTVLLATLSVAACGSSKYVSLTAANLSSQLEAAVQNKHSAHEVTTSDGKTATVDFDTSQTLRYRMVTGSGSATRTMIGIGSDVYLQVGSGPWLKTEAVKLTANDVNPVAMVIGFNQGLRTLAYLGASTIDGTQVQHYQVVIDQAKYLQSQGQGTGSNNLGASESITEDLFLNNDNTLRRVAILMPGGVGNVQIDVTNWGEPVQITAPPAAEVSPAPSASPSQ